MPPRLTHPARHSSSGRKAVRRAPPPLLGGSVAGAVQKPHPDVVTGGTSTIGASNLTVISAGSGFLQSRVRVLTSALVSSGPRRTARPAQWSPTTRARTEAASPAHKLISQTARFETVRLVAIATIASTRNPTAQKFSSLKVESVCSPRPALWFCRSSLPGRAGPSVLLVCPVLPGYR